MKHLVYVQILLLVLLVARCCAAPSDLPYKHSSLNDIGINDGHYAAERDAREYRELLLALDGMERVLDTLHAALQHCSGVAFVNTSLAESPPPLPLHAPTLETHLYNGSECGSAAQPCGSLQEAVDRLAAGGCVLLLEPGVQRHSIAASLPLHVRSAVHVIGAAVAAVPWQCAHGVPAMEAVEGACVNITNIHFENCDVSGNCRSAFTVPRPYPPASPHTFALCGLRQRWFKQGSGGGVNLESKKAGVADISCPATVSISNCAFSRCSSGTVATSLFSVFSLVCI